MKVLVTGGCGFIGSHLVEVLLQGGNEVVVLDNLACGRVENLAAVSANPKLMIHNADIRDREQIRELFRDVDWVFHLAGLADIVPSIEHPERYFEVNVHGTLNVLTCAREAAVSRFVYAASSSCYGIPDVYPTPETAPIRPMYPYALTKRLGEELVLHWSQTYGLPAISLRLFNVYGPRSRTSGTYGAVFGVFLAQKLAGKPFTVVGDGNQSRDFTYVTDVASAFLTAADCDISGEIMNVGSGGHYTVNRLVELLGGPVTYVPKRPGEPDCTFADTTKIHTCLGWSAQVSFEDGVERMLEQIDYWREAPLWDADSIRHETRAWFNHLGREQHPLGSN